MDLINKFDRFLESDLALSIPQELRDKIGILYFQSLRLNIINKKHNLTGVYEMDRHVLLQLDLESLEYMCSTNKYFYDICQNDYFWRLKVQHDFGDDVAQLKPLNDTFKKQYYYISDIDSDDAAKDGRLDAMIWMERDNRYMDLNTAMYAVIGGNLEILKLLAEMDIFPGEDDIEADIPLQIMDVNKYNQLITREIRKCTKAKNKTKVNKNKSKDFRIEYTKLYKNNKYN